MGEAINLVENFKVEKVVFNCGEFNDLEKELIKVLDKKHIKYYSCIKELNIDNNKLYFLQTKEYDNENDNSNVIYTKIDDNFAYIFDPYYSNEDYYVKDDNVAIILHKTFTHNRLVKIERLFDEQLKDFSLLEENKRSVILINR